MYGYTEFLFLSLSFLYRSHLQILISPNPSLVTKSSMLPWSGQIYVQCDSQQKVFMYFSKLCILSVEDERRKIQHCFSNDYSRILYCLM